MKSHARLKSIPVAILMAFGTLHLSANASLVTKVCQVNDINACDSPNSTVGASSILTIRGYAFDLATGDKPTDSAGGYVLVRNEDTLVTYKLPIQRVEARPDIVGPAITGTLLPSGYDVVNAGFIAQVFMASLPAGTYSVKEAGVNMKVAGLTKLPIDDASSRATFTIGNATSPFRLVGQDGTSIPLSMGKAASGVIPATGYPALRDGAFTIKAALQTLAGASEQSLNFTYRRPTLNVPVSLPIAVDFPGVTARVTPTNPLTNKALDVATLPIVVDAAQGSSIAVNGTTINQGSTLDISRVAALAGVYQVALRDDGVTEASQTVKLWVNLPDAPNINIVSNRWDPARKILVNKSKDAAAVKVEDLDVAAKLDSASTDTCQTLTMIRPEYMLSQVANVTCAIQFGDLPVGMKYNPYQSNALRGSVPVVGDNPISFTPGVVYTDSNKKTAFYPAKSGTSTLSITGTEPAAIQLTFKQDKLLDTIYSKNSSQYPGAGFATVDLAQARALGVMNVKAGYRDVMTRVTYSVDNVKESVSSIPESNVALVMQASEPWKHYPVTVEAWYQKAPEYKSTQTIDFIGVPMTPIVDLEKTFSSHDKATTIIHGQVGISKGQVLSFDPAAMGTWQVAIKEDKTGNSLSAPVPVASDGTFAVDLGILTAGTRYIVAEAKMVSSDVGASNSSVVSKSRALITAVGESIDATLSARSTSGKAPFVQTINATLKVPKLLSSVKGVYWERLKSDGSWERLMKSDTVEQVGVNYTATLDVVSQVQYRAVIVNRYSGVESVTAPITLTAFDVPTFRVNTPGVVQVKRPVTLTVESDEGFNATYSWRMLTTGGVDAMGPTDGRSFTFTPTEMKNYAVEVTGRSANAPSNPAADVTKTIAIKAVNPLAAHASITGPTYVEASKTYIYKASINDVVPPTASKAYVIKGYWVLPDGTRVDGTDLSYTPRAGDTTLSYYTYVDGYPDETTVSTYAFKTWSYAWPATWRIKLTPQALDVPAYIKYSVDPVGFDLKTLNGEPLTYTWALPQDVTRTSGNEIAGVFTITKNGTYQVAVQVADTRGNVVNVNSDEFTILPPATVKTTASIISKYGTAFYAPGTYYISVKISEIPRGDSFLRNDVLINGSKVGEFTGSGNYVSFSDPGDYDVIVRTITKAGNYGEQTLSVVAAPPPQPVCDIKQSSTTSGVLLTPACTVEVGYIKALTWTYKLDGVDQKATSKSFLVAKDWINNKRISGLTLLIETDLGAQKTEPVILN